jgi:RNA polymerase sigma-70 factor (ECF subfamily)
MSSLHSNQSFASDNGRPRQFETTHWSEVRAAAAAGSLESEEALERLCRSYWKPLCAYAHRLGYTAADAEDLTQSFFLFLLKTQLVGKANVEGGKFRSFLLVCLKNFIRSQRDHATAQKRGGGQTIQSIDQGQEEGDWAGEPREADTPESIYETAWAMTVLEQALAWLEREYQEMGRNDQFDLLKGFLQGDKASMTYSQLAETLGTSESAVKMMVHRMRRRYHECLRAVLAPTVSRISEIEEELCFLRSALSK